MRTRLASKERRAGAEDANDKPTTRSAAGLSKLVFLRAAPRDREVRRTDSLAAQESDRDQGSDARVRYQLDDRRTGSRSGSCLRAAGAPRDRRQNDANDARGRARVDE